MNGSNNKRKRDAKEESDEDDEERGLSLDSDEGSETDESEDSEDPLVTSDEEDEDVASMGAENEESDSMGEDAEPVHSDADSDGDSSEEETQAEKDRKAAYFDDNLTASSGLVHTSFLTMNLSRPILRALTSLSFSSPTPIQTATIPVALLGKDVVGNAVTGSGKTAAFMIPVLERLLYREKGKNAAAVRCVVLVPTRELGSTLR